MMGAEGGRGLASASVGATSTLSGIVLGTSEQTLLLLLTSYAEIERRESGS